MAQYCVTFYRWPQQLGWKLCLWAVDKIDQLETTNLFNHSGTGLTLRLHHFPLLDDTVNNSSDMLKYLYKVLKQKII